ncbi:hypothetical protein SARC_02897 [Sphaeroforma arctica JP610]|uniref:AMP-activated protein kinase glycogen-binding domain-containing protein n=1 Tax=Sphaeroforma arctica JP610 TaxID=667725 RepID=A0A0L0G769_9EUKA|nr:hypothetical protein SARC_02897 [Sphaeroforma arctica JP610]KNC84887.1 hypothetical protein SARC_02897 [Sphaeroforma arctica JP610]|eukprot:XP_014158789.1 hypothetical protein SARC_02897 [Sphaeroforma arctica JP610]
MDESSSRGAFVTTLDLSPGVYQYIFCLDDETWATNPNAPLITLTDGKTVNYIEVIEGVNVIATQPDVVRSLVMPTDGLCHAVQISHLHATTPLR